MRRSESVVLQGRWLFRLLATGSYSRREVAIETRFTPTSEGFWSDYDVSLDGREFLMLKMDDLAAAPQLHVIVKALK